MVLRFLFIAFLLLLGCGDLKFDDIADPRNISHPSGIKYQSFKDARDGKTYKSVVIGTQTWMAENLNYNASGSFCLGRFNTLVSEGGYCDIYGRLYDLETALSICPDGWHLPNKVEWETLNKFVGYSGNKLKSVSGWANYLYEDHSSNRTSGNGTDDYGFTALPGGQGRSDGYSSGVGDMSWWCKDETGESFPSWAVSIISRGDISSVSGGNGSLCSVRCIKDELCGSNTYNPWVQFCDKNVLYNLCGGKTYAPATERCGADGTDEVVETKCGTGWINTGKQFCSGNNSYDLCGGKTYDVAAQRCKNSVVEAKCGTDWYEANVDYLRCENGTVETKCGTGWFKYNISTQYCNGTTIEYYGTLTDARNSKTYKTIEINNLIWMAENLNYAESSSKCYNNLESNCNTYGRLYYWSAARSVCPSGWHLPNLKEWQALGAAVGSASTISGYSTAGKLLKSRNGWDGNGNGADNFGFSALPGGSGGSDGSFSGIGNQGRWWGSSEVYQQCANAVGGCWVTEDKVSGFGDPKGLCSSINSSSESLSLYICEKNTFSSVRCVQTPGTVVSSSSVGSVVPSSSSKSSGSACTAADNNDEDYCSNGTLKKYGIMTDDDGQDYKTVKIGNQTWMAENLNYDVSGSDCYDDDYDNCDLYGRLYDWETATGVCPSGWHLPSDAEWTTLTTFVGTDPGKKLKANSSLWQTNTGTDNYGFSALPGGSGASDGTFSGVGQFGFWWSTTEDNASNAYYRYMLYSNATVSGITTDKAYFFSVRCVED